jgi:hypothetical protein
MDTAGAMLGPVVAFGLLMIVPLGFDTVFVVSFCLAVIGLAILVLLVQPRAVTGNAVDPCPAMKRAIKCQRCTWRDGAASSPPSLCGALDRCG